MQFTPAELNNLVTAALPQLSSGMTAMFENVNREGLDTYLNHITEETGKALKDMKNELDTISDLAKQDLSDPVQISTTLSQDANKLLQDNKKLLNEQSKFLKTVTGQIENTVKEMKDNQVNENLKETTNSALKFAQSIQQINAETEVAIDSLQYLF